MHDYPEALDLMLSVWNESDPSKVRAILDKALSPNIRFVDPTIDVTGIDGFERNVHEVKSKIPGAIYTRESGLDSQHNFYRYHWAIHHEGKLIVSGFDVTEVDDQGKVACVIGFFGPIPKKQD